MNNDQQLSDCENRVKYLKNMYENLEYLVFCLFLSETKMAKVKFINTKFNTFSRVLVNVFML